MFTDITGQLSSALMSKVVTPAATGNYPTAAVDGGGRILYQSATLLNLV